MHFVPGTTYESRVARYESMRRLGFLLLLIILPACSGDLFDPFGTGKYEYDVRTPPTYGSSGTRQWPVLVFLHGAGGLPVNYIANFTAGADSFVLVTPHTVNQWEPDRLSNLLDEVEGKYRINTHRVYVTGFSMGAHGTFDWAAEEPNRIAAALMIAGAGPSGGGCKIKTVPAYFIHNRNDPVVPTSETERTVAELRACNAFEVQMVINEEPGFINTHDAWTSAYRNPALYAWLLGHTK